METEATQYQHPNTQHAKEWRERETEGKREIQRGEEGGRRNGSPMHGRKCWSNSSQGSHPLNTDCITQAILSKSLWCWRCALTWQGRGKDNMTHSEAACPAINKVGGCEGCWGDPVSAVAPEYVCRSSRHDSGGAHRRTHALAICMQRSWRGEKRCKRGPDSGR